MARELLEHYPQEGERYDELFGAARPRAPLAAAARAARRRGPPRRMRERLQSVQGQVRENGVTYNVYADPQGPTGPGSSTCCR